MVTVDVEEAVTGTQVVDDDTREEERLADTD